VFDLFRSKPYKEKSRKKIGWNYETISVFINPKIISSRCVNKVLFLAYWELNPNFNPVDLAELGSRLGQVDIEGTEMIGWYITADGWGVSISKAESEAAFMKGVYMWRIAMPGIFKEFKSSVAMETINLIPEIMELAKEMK
jgi:hypothetical protein